MHGASKKDFSQKLIEPDVLIHSKSAPARIAQHTIGKKYVLDEASADILGKGEFGPVLKGRALRNGSEVAIKKVPMREEHRLKFLKHFRKLDDENLMKLLTVVKEGDHYFVVTELCDSNMKEWLIISRHWMEPLTKQPLNMDELKNLAKQLVNGYRTLYENNIIHRDLQPCNILLTKTEAGVRYKIAGFGQAERLKNARASLRDARVTAWSMYSAPELLTGGSYDHRADIFSLGLILHECATGSGPNMKVENEPQLEPLLDGLLDHMLNDNPQERMNAVQMVGHPYFEGLIPRKSSKSCSIQ